MFINKAKKLKLKKLNVNAKYKISTNKQIISRTDSLRESLSQIWDLHVPPTN